jgi:hypothetical protein
MTRSSLPSSHTRGRLAATIGTAAACLLTLTACDGSEATPPPSPPTSSSTPATTTPSTPATTPKPPPPTVPPASFTVSSAEAFARFYLKAKEHAALTGDVSLMRKWADGRCIICRALADGYHAQYAAGGSIKGDVSLTVTRVDRARLVGDSTAEVVLTGRVGRFLDTDRAGAAPKVYPGGPVTWELALTKSAGRWLVYEMVRK